MKIGDILLEILNEIDPDLINCNLRSEMEKNINLIALGKVDY